MDGLRYVHQVSTVMEGNLRVVISTNVTILRLYNSKRDQATDSDIESYGYLSFLGGFAQWRIT